MPRTMESFHGSDLGLSRLQHHALVQHTAQTQCCSGRLERPWYSAPAITPEEGVQFTSSDRYAPLKLAMFAHAARGRRLGTKIQERFALGSRDSFTASCPHVYLSGQKYEVG